MIAPRKQRRAFLSCIHGGSIILEEERKHGGRPKLSSFLLLRLAHAPQCGVTGKEAAIRAKGGAERRNLTLLGIRKYSEINA